jgi:FdrA protein
MSGTRVLEESAGVIWGSSAMATPANIEELVLRGFPAQDLEGAKPGDLFIAVEADDEDAALGAADRAEAAVFSSRRAAITGAEEAPISLDQALRLQPSANIAIISVPGDYAALEANKALGRGLDVLLFSDNVSRADEIALKDHAAARGRLVMGPGAGTAMLAGVGLAFANVVSPGPVGVIAAAGTGAQEAMALLDRWGVGVSQVIGLGGRDLNEDIGGRMAALAIQALKGDPKTEIILFVSKPPAPQVAKYVMSLADGIPMVAAFMGVDLEMTAPPGVIIADTLEGGVLARAGHPGYLGDSWSHHRRSDRSTAGRTYPHPRPVLRRNSLLRGLGSPSKNLSSSGVLKHTHRQVTFTAGARRLVSVT